MKVPDDLPPRFRAVLEAYVLAMDAALAEPWNNRFRDAAMTASKAMRDYLGLPASD